MTAALAGASGEERARRLAGDTRLEARYEAMRDESEAVWKDVNKRQHAKTSRMTESWQGKLRSQLGLSRALASASPLGSLTFALTELADTGFGSSERFARQVDAYDQTLHEYLERRYHEAQATRPTHSTNDFLDVKDRPRFRYRPPGFAERLAAAAPHAELLGAWCALFLLAALVSFQRFDVR